MQKYRPKTALAAVADKLFRAMAACALGTAWFVFLWGLSLPDLTAGAALGGLLWLCARQFGKMSTARREKQMRRLIGGELALAELLLSPPRKAAFQAALWIAPRIPLVMETAGEWEITGKLDGKPALMRLIAQHESEAIRVQQVIDVLRSAKAQKMERCILCVTAPLSPDARSYAASAELDVRVVAREEMIDLAGLARPATDADLQKLAQKTRSSKPIRQWVEVILEPSRSKRYFWYGTGLLALAFLTRRPFYPLPSILCFVLYAFSQLRRFKERRRHSTA